MKYVVTWRHAGGGGGFEVEANSPAEAIRAAEAAGAGQVCGEVDVRPLPPPGGRSGAEVWPAPAAPDNDIDKAIERLIAAAAEAHGDNPHNRAEHEVELHAARASLNAVIQRQLALERHASYDEGRAATLAEMRADTWKKDR